MRRVLGRSFERTVQREHVDLLASRFPLDVGHRAPNLGGAGQEAKHVAAGLAQHLDGGLRRRLPGRVGGLDRVEPAGHVDDGTAPEESRHGTRVEGRRHHNDAEVVSSPPGLLRQRDRQVGVNASLVKFVEDDRLKVRQERVVLQPRGQDAFGHHEQPRVAGEAPLEPDLPADLAANRPAALLGDARRDGPRSHAARLQQDDAARRPRARAAHASSCPRLAAATTTTAAGLMQGRDDAPDERIDRKGKHQRTAG